MQVVTGAKQAAVNGAVHGATKAGQFATSGGQLALSGVGKAGHVAMTKAGQLGDFAYQQVDESGLISKAILKKEEAKAKMIDVSAPLRQKMMTNLREMTVELATADPDMWKCVKNGIGSMTDLVFSDLEIEMERNLKLAMLKQAEDDNAPGPASKSIFGKMKDPVWWLITILICLPIYGIRVVISSILLVMLIFPRPPNEYQLINFILLFKGTQFFTLGIMSMAIGAMQYFSCYSWSRDRIAECIDTRGPGAFESLAGEAFDYIGSIVLVWVAFCALPCSARVGPVRFVGQRRKDQEEASDTEDSFGVQTRGGRLRSLLCYDMVCFLITWCALFGVTLATSWDKLSHLGTLFTSPQFTANLFWCRVLYGLLSFPFVLFVIPVVSGILTHSDPTGFNESGACVAFELPADGFSTFNGDHHPESDSDDEDV